MGVCMSMEPLNENQIMACCPESSSLVKGELVKNNSAAPCNSTIVEVFTPNSSSNNIDLNEETQCVESIASSESSDSMCIIDNNVELPSDGTNSKPSTATCKIQKKPAVIHKASIPTIFIQFASNKRLSKNYYMDSSDERYLSPSEVC